MRIGWRSLLWLSLCLLLCVLPGLVLAQRPGAASSSQWAITGQQLYQSGQFAEAATVWQKAAEVYRQTQDPLNEAMALSNLSLTEQQLEQWERAKNAIAKSLTLLKAQPPSNPQQQVLAATLDIQGQLQYSTAQFETALQTWQDAAKLYPKAEPGNTTQAIANQINQAQAMQALGLYPRACQTLLASLRVQQAHCDPGTDFASAILGAASDMAAPQKITSLRSLGNVLRIMAQPEQSQRVLKIAWQLAQQSSPADASTLTLALGNTARSRGNLTALRSRRVAVSRAGSPVPDCLADAQPSTDAYYQQAALCYRQAAASTDPQTALQAQLNLLNLVVQTRPQQRSALLPPLLTQIQEKIVNLPASRASIAARLKLAQSLLCLQPVQKVQAPVLGSPVLQSCPPSDGQEQPQILPMMQPERLMQEALQQAKQLGNSRLEANVIGYLAGLAQQRGNVSEAQRLTQTALQNISTFENPELAYLWQWQLGRLYQLQQKPTEAIAAYTNAFELLQSLRRDIVAVDSNLQFAFRDSVEPVYRELVDLLLTPPATQASPSQQNLKQARSVIEALQVAALNNFFREACVEARPQPIDRLDAKAATLYGIILPDRLAVIASIPGKPLHYHATPLTSAGQNVVSQGLTSASQRPEGSSVSNHAPNRVSNRSEVERTLTDLYATLTPFVESAAPLQPKQKIYDWLIRPIAADLEQANIETLVFVLDGALRNLPVAVLHDGSQYLIEKYRLALTPGLQLLASRTQSLQKLKVLAGGLSEAQETYPPLPGVERELIEISAITQTDKLLNRDFTQTRLRSQLEANPFSIVHLATHAQFSSSLEDTFLLTWQERVNVKNLDTLLQERPVLDWPPIELLVLSACQTAVGDSRSALGLAGVAVRSGARSTLATLWAVQDQSTADLMTQFYKALSQPNISKAEALRQGQLALLHSAQYQHPYYWAPFVLVGNWQ